MFPGPGDCFIKEFAKFSACSPARMDQNAGMLEEIKKRGVGAGCRIDSTCQGGATFKV